MAQPRVWERLSPTTRKRYIAKGKSLNQTPAQVQAYYESGGTMGAYRGHKPHYGASERQWSAMVSAARRSKLGNDAPEGVTGPTFISSVLENLLSKGFTPQWITARLEEKHDSRTTFRTTLKRAERNAGIEAGWNPGRRRYHARPLIADVEIYWYH